MNEKNERGECADEWQAPIAESSLSTRPTPRLELEQSDISISSSVEQLLTDDMDKSVSGCFSEKLWHFFCALSYSD